LYLGAEKNLTQEAEIKFRIRKPESQNKSEYRIYDQGI